MKNTKFLTYIAVFSIFFFFQCKSNPENKKEHINDKQNNKVYIHSSYDQETINPTKNKTKRKTFSVFIYNETNNLIITNENVKIKPNNSSVFKVSDNKGITLNNGIQFFLGETEGLEVIDNKIQVAGLGGEWLEKLSVPKSVDWAFSILKIGEGDPIPE